MSNKHLLLRSEGEHHSYLIVVPLTDDFLATLRARLDSVRSLSEGDNDFSGLSFFNYNLTVCEAEDLHETFGDGESLIVDGEPEDMGVAQRVDFAEMVFGPRDTLSYRFGIKHVPEIYETRMCNLRVLLG